MNKPYRIEHYADLLGLGRETFADTMEEVVLQIFEAVRLNWVIFNIFHEDKHLYEVNVKPDKTEIIIIKQT